MAEENTEISLEIYQQTVNNRIAQLEADLVMAQAVGAQLRREKQDLLDKLNDVVERLEKFEQMPEPDPIPSTKNKEVEVID